MTTNLTTPIGTQDGKTAQRGQPCSSQAPRARCQQIFGFNLKKKTLANQIFLNKKIQVNHWSKLVREYTYVLRDWVLHIVPANQVWTRDMFCPDQLREA